MKKALIILLILVGLYNVYKPLPDGISLLGDGHMVPNESVVFIADKTFVDAEGIRHTDQAIFDEVFSMIDNAEHYILIDMFLLNDFQGQKKESTRFLSSELMNILLKKAEDYPDIIITLITDPINTVYGGVDSAWFESLREAGIKVVITDLKDLRDSNPIYSSVWRSFIQWFGNNTKGSVVPHPFSSDEGSVTVRSYLSLFNFKANHRKLIVADNSLGGEDLKMITLITSANPHDGSSAHANSAIIVKDYLWKDVISSEESVVALSKDDIVDFPYAGDVIDRGGDVLVQLLTEGKIRVALIESIEKTKTGDTVDMSMFYFSDRKVIAVLQDSYDRGVKVRLLLDSNKDAFGRNKNGIPNRQVADELMSDGDDDLEIRWCDTHGEQCHTKLVLINYAESKTSTLITGSANLTKRNIGDYNLEANVLVSGNEDVTAIKNAYSYFDEVWFNTEDRFYSVSYDVYEDTASWKYVIYRIMEKAGLSSF